eukprot:CAMPEP_0174243228 /NCGR_PEP_ID=MMETSP0417-20130205/30915_1 /TAXON_ID=242541 /ORGANISM="Mayorella sp, Strain BSH-02190019" /LENGTH=403 /DNA_ID=CAMNT_0015322713 /DNA_START=94 /DNA_END=1303 /DNA_ORIENTATION=+
MEAVEVVEKVVEEVVEEVAGEVKVVVPGGGTEPGGRFFFQLRKMEQQEDPSFRRPRDICDLIQQASLVPDLDEVLVRFCTPFGQRVFASLLSELPNVLYASPDSQRPALLRTVTRFVQLIVDVDNRGTPHAGHLKQLIVMVYHTSAFMDMVVSSLSDRATHLEQVRPTTSAGPSRGERGQSHSGGQLGVYASTAKLFELMTRNVRDCEVNDEFVEWVNRTRAAWTVASSVLLLDSRDSARVAGSLDRIGRTLRRVHNLDPYAGENRIHAPPSPAARIAARQKEQISAPGELRPEGPRHQNDKTDFRQIGLLPTQDELLSPVEPFLPRPRGADHLVDQPANRYLDRHFRLFGADVIEPVAEAVQHISKRLLPAWKANKSQLPERSMCPETGARIGLLRDARFEG